MLGMGAIPVSHRSLSTTERTARPTPAFDLAASEQQFEEFDSVSAQYCDPIAAGHTSLDQQAGGHSRFQVKFVITQGDIQDDIANRRRTRAQCGTFG